MSKKKRAKSPIDWLSFQHLMSSIGYEMRSHTEDRNGIIFRLRSGANTEGLKNPVTVDYPDFVASDGESPAYEKNYVVDLINQISGGNGGKAVTTFLANRRFDG